MPYDITERNVNTLIRTVAGAQLVYSTDVRAISSAFECDTVFWEDNQQVGFYYVTYNTQTGKIEPPAYDRKDGTYTIIPINIGFSNNKIWLDDPGAEMEINLFGLGFFYPDKEERDLSHNLHERINVVPGRISCIEKDDWKAPENQNHDTMTWLPRDLDKFGEKQGDHVILDSIIRYNTEGCKPRYINTLGKEAIKEKEYEHAISMLDLSLSQDPNNVHTLYLLAIAHERQIPSFPVFHETQVYNALHKALEIKPNSNKLEKKFERYKDFPSRLRQKAKKAAWTLNFRERELALDTLASLRSEIK